MGVFKRILLAVALLLVAALVTAGGFSGGPFYNGSWRAVGKRFSNCQPVTAAATTYGCNGITVPTDTGTLAAQAGGNRYYIRHTTTTSVSNVAGMNASVAVSRLAYLPIFRAAVSCVSAVTARRIWVGLAESALGGVTPSIASAATGVDFVGVAYDSGVDASWLCCSGDGTNQTCVDTGLDVVADTDYLISVDSSTSGTLTCDINGTQVSKTTNISTGAIDFLHQLTITNLVNGTTRAMDISYWETEQM